jgi:hypothetical protein
MGKIKRIIINILEIGFPFIFCYLANDLAIKGKILTSLVLMSIATALMVGAMASIFRLKVSRNVFTPEKEKDFKGDYYPTLVRILWSRLAVNNIDGARSIIYSSLREEVKCRTCRKDITFKGDEFFDLQSEQWEHVSGIKDHRALPEGFEFKRIQAFHKDYLLEKLNEMKQVIAKGNKKETQQFLEDFSDAIER